MKPTEKQPSAASLKNWPAWSIFGLLWLAIRLPERWQMNLGKTLGKLLYLFPSKFKRTTETNIKLCMPETIRNRTRIANQKKLYFPRYRHDRSGKILLATP